jgi:hypothetical protein
VSIFFVFVVHGSIYYLADVLQILIQTKTTTTTTTRLYPFTDFFGRVAIFLLVSKIIFFHNNNRSWLLLHPPFTPKHTGETYNLLFVVGFMERMFVGKYKKCKIYHFEFFDKLISFLSFLSFVRSCCGGGAFFCFFLFVFHFGIP